MTWGVIVDVPAPVEVYDAVHAALLQRTGGVVDGLVVHLARATGDGFQIVEVWDSREQAERYEREVVGPVMARIAGGIPPAGRAVTEIEIHGLVVPRAEVAV
ncbi:hypothetical protein [Modestobacter excelsi]|uniref:hypothetical protein n=1 Tax=Modestobacter excelsi TaxID=2213161 RepID=UPI00110C8E62|nr:hypothetical protein [Modestobacter excelsi]